MVTVFDIASEFIERSDGTIESVKLQKLCFYAFGWFAHLTGAPLFGEKFYAMKFGPVVGELLSAHARQKTVDQSMLDAQFDARDTAREELTSYVEQVIDAVWETYGSRHAFDLAEYSHTEGVWKDAWEHRSSESSRADLPKREIIDYFLLREPRAGEVPSLPPTQVTIAASESLESAEDPSSIHQPFVDTMRKLQTA